MRWCTRRRLGRPRATRHRQFSVSCSRRIDLAESGDVADGRIRCSMSKGPADQPAARALIEVAVLLIRWWCCSRILPSPICALGECRHHHPDILASRSQQFTHLRPRISRSRRRNLTKAEKYRTPGTSRLPLERTREWEGCRWDDMLGDGCSASSSR